MDSDDLDSDAMAQAMGFASFGAQKPAAKRRRFNPAADAVVAGPDASHLPPRPPPSSASNAVPLGIRSRAQNVDEIDLEGDEDDNASGVSPPAQAATAASLDDLHAQPQADSASAFEDNSADAGIAGRRRDGQAGPAGRGGFRGRGPQQKSTWWIDYYDPSSNINPWERLEQERGLQPRGPWMSWDEAKSKA
ncbi:hypothetical protein Micbo1qcDRAFT_210783 [Microdochium bolleyi]|uniref:Uncharacterized protein n=1 Tax=Microdochium bolleyi TaxID=196109 RepID=A0A136JHA6_9PEZI|nr:hypothetical protein Micbo1qcDRAFT_210783 [Microdochium bolleyi]